MIQDIGWRFQHQTSKARWPGHVIKTIFILSDAQVTVIDGRLWSHRLLWDHLRRKLFYLGMFVSLVCLNMLSAYICGLNLRIWVREAWWWRLNILLSTPQKVITGHHKLTNFFYKYLTFDQSEIQTPNGQYVCLVKTYRLICIFVYYIEYLGQKWTLTSGPGQLSTSLFEAIKYMNRRVLTRQARCCSFSHSSFTMPDVILKRKAFP